MRNAGLNPYPILMALIGTLLPIARSPAQPLSHPIPQGLYLRVRITDYFNSLYCTARWSRLNDVGSSIFTRDFLSTGQMSYLPPTVSLELGAQTTLRANPLFMQGTFSHSLPPRFATGVQGIVGLGESNGEPHLYFQQNPSWIALNSALSVDVSTHLPMSAVGEIEIIVHAVKKGFPDSGTVRLGRIHALYDLQELHRASREHRGAPATIPFSAIQGNPENRCLQGWIQISEDRIDVSSNNR